MANFYSGTGWRVAVGDCRERLKSVKEKSVHAVCTSTPYWGQRGYGTEPVIWRGQPDCQHVFGGKNASSDNHCSKCNAWRGELGQEDRVEAFADHIAECFEEVHRIMRDDALLFLNIGDTFDADGKPSFVPFYVQHALIGIGFQMRSSIIWAKGTSGKERFGAPMSENLHSWRWERCRKRGGDPCTGCKHCCDHNGYRLNRGRWRPSRAYEYILMMSKSDLYYCDKQRVLESVAKATLQRDQYSRITETASEEQYATKHDHETTSNEAVGTGPRDVLRFDIGSSYKPSNGKRHSALYPLEIPSWCIKVATSPKGACRSCGAPWARVVDNQDDEFDERMDTREWRPTCVCVKSKPGPSVICDPFSGWATTGVAALWLDCHYIGTEALPENAEESAIRLNNFRSEGIKSSGQIRKAGRKDHLPNSRSLFKEG